MSGGQRSVGSPNCPLQQQRSAARVTHPSPAQGRQGKRPKTLVSGRGIFALAELCSLGDLGGLAWSLCFSGVTVGVQEPEEAACCREVEKGRSSPSP